MTAIQLSLSSNLDKNLISVILSMDLSAAYDTVDHVLLLDKLEHYRVRGKSLSLLTSFLNKRLQFVQIDGAVSPMLLTGEYSVIQGSKIANILYTLYINELPSIFKLLKSYYYSSLTKLPALNPNNTTTHSRMNFVDDSTNIMGFSKFENIKPYLESYYTLIHTFYNINKLKINDDKNQLTIIAPAKFNKQIHTFTFSENNFQINHKPKI